jgi:integrase
VTLYKRGRVYWSYVYSDGIRHAKSTGTGNVRIAEQVDRQFKEELELARLGMRIPTPDMTFGALAAQFIAEGVPKTWHLDRLKLLLPYFGEMPIGRIQKDVVRKYRAHRHAQKTVSDTTINRDLECLRHLLYWAVDEGYLVANPLRRMPLVRERRKPRMVVSVGDELRLLRAAAPHLRAIIIAALDTGMRRGELLSQRWEHIDFDRGLLSVTHSKTPEGEAREIPLARRLRELLAGSAQPQGLVFTFRGKPIRILKTAWKSAIRRSCIPWRRFHDLRHTFTTRLMELGVPREVRMSLTGHSSGEDVHDRYVHVEMPIKREAIHRLELWHEAQVQAQEKLGVVAALPTAIGARLLPEAH